MLLDDVVSWKGIIVGCRVTVRVGVTVEVGVTDEVEVTVAVRVTSVGVSKSRRRSRRSCRILRVRNIFIVQKSRKYAVKIQS